MTRFLTIIPAIFAAMSALASSPASSDTLLLTPDAKSIYIQSNKKATSVTVRRIGGTSDNFFYEAGTSSRVSAPDQSIISYDNVKNVLVVESESKTLNVSFSAQNNDEISYSFTLPDLENRFVNTYIGRNGSDFGITIKRAGRTTWDLISGGWGFGWVAPIADEPSLDANMWKSNELTWAIVLGVKMSRGRHSLAAGLGIDWRNYVTKGNRYFHKDDEGRISLMPYDPDSRKHRSRIKTFSLQVPLIYGISFGHNGNCHFNLGPILCFNTSAGIKTQYSIGSRDYSIKTHNIRQRPVTVDLFGEFQFKSVGLYVRYSPMEILKTSAGLSFKSLSTGIMIGI
ncbi:MAG: hypothetical protein NC102_07910 [Clostridium sp.]|nr:hypothetical protein [Clostridium sp.]